jgi:aminoglycoside 6'-N-acetyltransferase
VRAEIIRDGDIVVRRVGEDDIAVLIGWLSDERVAARYGGRDRAADELAFVTKYLAEDEVNRCIVEIAGNPVGYVQFYPVDDAGSYDLDDGTGVWAMDQFIGVPDLWGQGMGSRFVRLVAEHLRATVASRVVTDPAVANTRAVRAYEKAGFVTVKKLPRHEVHEGEWLDCFLMEFRA